MALLTIAMALAAPSLARSLRERGLAQEGARVLAAIEYGRDQAVSQGVPMTLWIEPGTGRFGVEPKPGYEAAAGRERFFTLNEDVHFEAGTAPQNNGVVEVVEFAPDGSPGEEALDFVGLRDRFNAAMSVSRTRDGWGYELLEEAPR